MAYDLPMASLTKKVIRGRAYYYARECKRVNGRPKIVWQKYLGRAEDIIEANRPFKPGFRLSPSRRSSSSCPQSFARAPGNSPKPLFFVSPAAHRIDCARIVP